MLESQASCLTSPGPVAKPSSPTAVAAAPSHLPVHRVREVQLILLGGVNFWGEELVPSGRVHELSLVCFEVCVDRDSVCSWEGRCHYPGTGSGGVHGGGVLLRRGWEKSWQRQL